MITRVKICGIKSLADALRAVEFGADSIGLLVGAKHTSQDVVTDDIAKMIIEALPPFISSVLIFHIADISQIIDTTSRLGATAITLHEGVEIEDVARIKDALPYLQIYKSIYVTDMSTINEAKKWAQTPITAVHLDSADLDTGRLGGTGKVHDWSISAQIVKEINKPVILAGGLTPENVPDAIQTIHPYAVDVNTGTRGTDGFRDLDKLKWFISQAKII